jgi:hypothetical protein
MKNTAQITTLFALGDFMDGALSFHSLILRHWYSSAARFWWKAPCSHTLSFNQPLMAAAAALVIAALACFA